MKDRTRFRTRARRYACDRDVDLGKTSNKGPLMVPGPVATENEMPFDEQMIEQSMRRFFQHDRDGEDMIFSLRNQRVVALHD